MAELDAGVIELARAHLPALSNGAFDDPRLEIVIGDGKDYVASTERRFDVVIVDSTDPIGPGEALFTPSFYADCRRVLRSGGVIVTQNGVPFFQPDELAATIRAFSALFADATCYLAAVPTYVGGFMAFGWGSDDPSLRECRWRRSRNVRGVRHRDPVLHARGPPGELRVAALHPRHRRGRSRTSRRLSTGLGAMRAAQPDAIVRR